MSNVAEKMTQRLVSAALIKPEDSSLYQYGLQQGLFMLLNFFTTVVVGLLFGMLWQSILFSLVYMPLRMNAGGYHARTPLRCYIFSTALIFAVLSVIRLVLYNKLICGIMAAVGAAIIFALAPVENANKPLDEIERKVYRKRARLTLLFWMITLLFGFALGWQAVSATIATAVATMGGMVGAGKLIKESFELFYLFLKYVNEKKKKA